MFSFTERWDRWVRQRAGVRFPRRFGMSVLLWLTVLAAVIFAWRRDHLRQADAISRLRGELLAVGKQDAPWGVEQLIGPPDTVGSGDLVTAWAPATPDNQPEWLDLEYADAVQPIEIEVHETYNPGALTKASIFDPLGREIVVWQGVDPTSPGQGRGESKIPVQTVWKTKRVKLYFDSPAVPGWNEIDAVGLRDSSGRVQWAQNATASSAYGGRFAQRLPRFPMWPPLVAKGSLQPQTVAPAARPNRWIAEGRVTDRAGHPVAGAAVRANCGWATLFRTGEATTDAQGRYRLEFGPGVQSSSNLVQAAVIFVSKPSYFEVDLCKAGDKRAAFAPVPQGDPSQPALAAGDLFLPGKPLTIDFVLDKAARLAGTLVDERGQPLANYGVSLQCDPLPPASSVLASVETNDQGRFEFTDLPTGRDLQLVVRRPGRGAPWNYFWASPKFTLDVADPSRDFVGQIGDEPIADARFELQIRGPSVDDDEALQAADERSELIRSPVALRWVLTNPAP